jgi:molecular chaperone DnaK (HSP70)
MGALLDECERVKCQLSDSSETNIIIAKFFGGRDLEVRISRKAFRRSCCELLSEVRLLEPARCVLASSQKQKSDVKIIFLFDGSSQIPKIRKRLQTFFGRDLFRGPDPHEAVVRDAVLMTAKRKNIPAVVVLESNDICPFHISVQSQGDYMSRVIRQGSRLPAKAENGCSIAVHNQTSMVIPICED